MLKRLMLMVAVAGLFVGTGNVYAQCSKSCSGEAKCNKTKAEDGAALTEARIVNRTEVVSMIGQQGVTIIDARDDESYQEGHIDGAVLFNESALPTDKGATLIFYCGSLRCPASSHAAKKAIELGYTNVMVFKEGWTGWTAG